MNRELAIGQLKVANTGDQLLQILDILANEVNTEEANDDWYTDPNSRMSYHHYWVCQLAKCRKGPCGLTRLAL